MYTSPRTDDPIGGLVPTGHTFSVGLDACIGCHQEKIYTRDELVKLGGVTLPTPAVNPDFGYTRSIKLFLADSGGEPL